MDLEDFRIEDILCLQEVEDVFLVSFGQDII